jgi:hypothetical protein
MSGLDPALCEFHGETADFLNRPSDEFLCVWRFVFFGAVLA